MLLPEIKFLFGNNSDSFKSSVLESNSFKINIDGEFVSPNNILRIKNILNKTKSDNLKRVIEFGNIKIDLNKSFIYKDKKQFKINNTEKIILEKMINSPGQTFSRENIGKIINLDKERSIDVIITRLRKKIEQDPKNPKFLQTIRGSGYVLWIE